MKINELISNFKIWTTNEESELLKKLQDPIKLYHLNDHDQLIAQNMIRKSLVTKIGFTDPTVVANDKSTK
jgi:hypothetical protein